MSKTVKKPKIVQRLDFILSVPRLNALMKNFGTGNNALQISLVITDKAVLELI